MEPWDTPFPSLPVNAVSCASVAAKGTLLLSSDKAFLIQRLEVCVEKSLVLVSLGQSSSESIHLKASVVKNKPSNRYK